MSRARTASPESSSSEMDDTPVTTPSGAASLVGDDGYAAASFPGYAEKPLDEQLEPIAVVGMACRLPGDVKSASGFWDMMMSKGTGRTAKVPASRFNIDAHIHKNNDRPGSFGVLGGYFLEGDLTEFDPGLFGITPVEAMWMDPQQRKLLEVVYEALEAGGIPLDKISGTRTGVFAASFTSDWQQMAFKEHSFRHNLAATGVDPGIISNRISHVFNLNGPSMMCNTACSSSVYALHAACNFLRNGEAEGAIVGGVNLIITVDQHMNTAKLGVLSPTSTCHTFDASADGYGRAEAVGAVYLKRLSDAVRDGDPIRGVIRSSATNSNGKVPAAGITHPNRAGQAEVIAAAYKRGGDLDPRLTGYFECHGTGTPVGDPLEVNAVAIAMNKGRMPGEEPLLIGAVKTNIGHSEAASGLSALIRAILIVERGVIPATRGVVNPNPAIRWDEWQVRVPTEAVPFPRELPVRRVSINSFGYGGTNAHCIVEGTESLTRDARAYTYHDTWTRPPGFAALHDCSALERERPFLLPFSAHDKATLRRNVDAHGTIADRYDLIDLSYTLATRRSDLSSRAFAVTSASTLSDVFGDVEGRFSFADKKTKSGNMRSVAFAFTGQGAQWARMGAELMTYCPGFLRSLRSLDRVLHEIPDRPGWTIEDLLLEHAETSRVNEAEFSQPLCTAVQVAMVQLLDTWGIRPVVTVGHSSGEIAAAYAAGLISADDAITAAYYRGKVAKDVNTAGAMMAVGLGAEAVQPYLDHADVKGRVVVACHNSPSLVTVSGNADAVESVRAKLDAAGVFARPVKTSGKAYHSHHMAPVSSRYEQLVRAAKAAQRKPGQRLATTARMVSSVTNAVLPTGTVLDETYWSANLCSPALFNQAVQTILKPKTEKEQEQLGFGDVDLFLEVGPHSAMAGPIKQIRAEVKAEKLEYVPTMLRGQDCAVRLLKVAGEMFLRGYPLDMEKVTHAYVEPTSSHECGSGGKPATGSVIVDLPPYQWNHTRPFWAESRTSREHRHQKFPRHDLLGQLVLGNAPSEPTWRNVLRARDLPWLKDHRLGGESVFPAAGYFSMAIEAIRQINETSGAPVPIESYVLRDVSIKTALVTPDKDDGVEVLLGMRASVYGHGWWDWTVSSVSVGGSGGGGSEAEEEESVKKVHMAGSIGINMRPRGGKAPRPVPPFTQRATGKAWNQALREVGFDYGPTFQDMDDIRFDGRHYQAACTTRIRQAVGDGNDESRYVLHPACIDSTLQLCIAAVHAGRTSAMRCGVVPVQVDEVAIWPPTEQQLRDAADAAASASAYAVVHRRGARLSESSVQMNSAADGGMVMEIVNMRATAYEAAVPQRAGLAAAALEEAAAPYGEMVWDLDFAAAENRNGLAASALVSLALFKDPGLRVVELGMKNTAAVLGKNPRASYTVVVTSDEEVEAAQVALSEYCNVKVVEIGVITTEELESQGLKKESYDILIAQGAGDDDGLVLSKLRGLLRSGALAVGPGVSVSFAGAITANEEGPLVASEKEKHSVQLVYRNNQSPVVSWVKAALEGLGWDVTVTSLRASDSGSAASGVAKHVIMLADFEGSSLLYTLQEDEFLAVQRIIAGASSLLWVTAGALLDGKKPEHAMVSGLARAVTSEQASIDFRTLDVDIDNNELAYIVKSVTRVAQLQLQALNAGEQLPEREFCVSDGKTYISRLVRNDALNSVYGPSDKPELKSFIPGNDRIAGTVLNGKVLFRQEEAGAADALQSGHVEVQVQSSGLTKEGVLAITGADYATTFSHEIGGIVTRIAPGVNGFQVGDRVVGFSVSRFDSHQQVPAGLLQKLDAQDDMDKITSVLTASAAALHGLETLASLKEGENVLVLNNTGFAGAAAVKVAQVKGAIPYVVAKTDDEISFLQSHLGLDAGHIIRASDGLVSERLDQLTDGHGADVVFSAGSVDASAAHEAWRCIARFGRFVDGGRKANLTRTVLDGIPVQRGACYMPFDVLEIAQSRPALLSALLPRIVDYYKSGSIIVPGVAQSIHLADIDRAVSNFSDAFGAAKPIVQYRASSSSSSPSSSSEKEEKKTIQVLPARRRFRLSPDATYLLVGCLGGLGRSLTSWMMESGARRFTFLSRSGADSGSAAALVEELEAAGAFVQVVRGDVASRADVIRAVEGVSSEYPIKGVVNAAMVLRDGLFHSMNFNAWTQSVRPKVLGSENLHSVLAGGSLDFFVMTSSVSGILGTPGQSNYAAANAYLDALARHRRRAHQKATSVVLPMVLGVGVVAENVELEDALQRKGMYGIDEEHLLQSFEAAMQTTTTTTTTTTTIPHPDHIVVGLDPARLQKATSDPAATDSFWLEDARFSHVVHTITSSTDESSASAGGGAGADGQSILAAIKAAGSAAEATTLVCAHFADKLARMLMLDAADISADQGSVASYGIDSMIGAELRNWIFREFRLDVPFQQLLGPTLTIAKFAGLVCAAHGIGGDGEA